MKGLQRISGLSCGLIGVTDLERSMHFYCEGLGFRDAGTRVVDPELGVRRCRLESEGRFLVLETVPETNHSAWVGDDLQLGMRHIGMKVHDVELWAERARAAGARFTVEPKDAFGGVRIAFFQDPDGSLLEFVQGNVQYNKVCSEELVAREASLSVPVRPRVDHVAVSVGSLEASLRFYEGHLGFRVIGQLVRGDDPRGFVITYCQAGQCVLEMFSFSVPMRPNSWQPDLVAPGLLRLCLSASNIKEAERELVAAGAVRHRVPYGAGYAPVYSDPDGTPVELVEVGL